MRDRKGRRNGSRPGSLKETSWMVCLRVTPCLIPCISRTGFSGAGSITWLHRNHCKSPSQTSYPFKAQSRWVLGAHFVQEILSEVDFQLPGGARAVIVGPNGCGKTTLLTTIAQRESVEGHVGLCFFLVGPNLFWLAVKGRKRKTTLLWVAPKKGDMSFVRSGSPAFAQTAS